MSRIGLEEVGVDETVQWGAAVRRFVEAAKRAMRALRSLAAAVRDALAEVERRFEVARGRAPASRVYGLFYCEEWTGRTFRSWRDAVRAATVMRADAAVTPEWVWVRAW